MTRRAKPPTAKAAGKKLKVKKETLKDLDAKGKSRILKGGGLTFTCVPTEMEISCKVTCVALCKSIQACFLK